MLSVLFVFSLPLAAAAMGRLGPSRTLEQLVEASDAVFLATAKAKYTTSGLYGMLAILVVIAFALITFKSARSAPRGPAREGDPSHCNQKRIARNSIARRAMLSGIICVAGCSVFGVYGNPEFHVKQTLRGDHRESIRLEVFGSNDPNREGIVSIKAGADYLLFLKHDKDDIYYPASPGYAVLEVVNNGVVAIWGDQFGARVDIDEVAMRIRALR